MKILYAVQATGNGHVSRAIELLPHLNKYGNVDIFLSGNNCHLPLDAPVKYRSKGLSLYYNATGGLNYWKMLKNIHPLDLRKQVNDLPVEHYDLVINDFEFITAAACAKKQVPSIQVSHQASFQSMRAPRPATKNIFGEWLLKNYAKTSHYIGLHFEKYDDFILPPVIKKEIRNAQPVDKGHITVYLPCYRDEYLEDIFSRLPDFQFHIFSKSVKHTIKKGNITLIPINSAGFNQSLVECHAIITSAGFETPAEALYLGKKLLVVPIRGQYEQSCNAAALEQLGIPCIPRIDSAFDLDPEQWLTRTNSGGISSSGTTSQLIDKLFEVFESYSERNYTGMPSTMYA